MISENTPLVSSTSPLSYTSPPGRWGVGDNEAMPHEPNPRAQRMREYYNSVFRASGVGVEVRDVAVVKRSVLRLCGPSRGPPRICCQGVSAQFSSGRLHLVTDVDGVAGEAVLNAAAGRTACASGQTWIDGVAVEAAARSQFIACVGTSALLIPQLTVGEHLWCVVHLYKKERRSWKREMVLAAANFTNLDVRRRADDLTEVERFRLQVALELVLDPPVLFLFYTLDAMDLAHQIECASLLRRLTKEVSKTVVVCTRSLPMHLFTSADSLLLMGSGGLVLFSGKCTDAIPYFNRLRIPQSTPTVLWKALSPPWESAALSGGGAIYSPGHVPPLTIAALSSSQQRSREERESRLYSVMCTPPRLSSRLAGADLHDADAPFFTASDLQAATARKTAVVEVATSGDLVDLAMEWADSEMQTMFYAAKYYDSATHAGLLSSLEESVNEAPNRSTGVLFAPPRPAPNCVWKFFVLLTYTLKPVAREAELLFGFIFVSIGLMAVALLTHFQPESQGGMFNIRGLIFMAFTLVLFTNLMIMDRAQEQLRIAAEHRKRQLYGAASFTACLCIRVVLVRSVLLALFVPFVIFVLQSSYALALLAWCMSCTHAAFQYATAALLPSKWWTVRVWYAVFGCNIIFSGFLVNLHTFPSVLGALSFLRWGYGAVLHTWLHGRKFACDGANNTWYCYTGDEYLVAQGLEKDSVATAAAALTLSGAALIVLLGCVLHLRAA